MIHKCSHFRMIIPIRCFTCGKVCGNKWEAYLSLLQVKKRHPLSVLPVIYLGWIRRRWCIGCTWFETILLSKNVAHPCRFGRKTLEFCPIRKSLKLPCPKLTVTKLKKKLLAKKKWKTLIMSQFRCLLKFWAKAVF